MRRTTIRDIAQHTGMSITAVSLVLNNKPCKISEESRKKICLAAKELHYFPNQLAVGLATRRTRTLGLIVCDISNAFFSILTKGVDQACQEQGWSVVLCNSWNTHQGDLQMIDVLAGRGVEGIIFCMSDDTTAELAWECETKLKKYNIPFVEVDSDYTNNHILFDNEQGGYLATQHLIANGHRKIACITGPSVSSVDRGRAFGYRRALQEAGIPFCPELVVEGDYGLESGSCAIRRLAGQAYTAVFACNDMMAFGALKQLRRDGIRIPEDVSLVGYDDVPTSEILEVPLTTIRQPMYEMGVAAARKLISLLEHPAQDVGLEQFTPQLICRKSVRNLTSVKDNRIEVERGKEPF